MFWALQKRKEDIQKAWREGFEEGRRRGRQAALEKLEAEMPQGNAEALAENVQQMMAGGPAAPSGGFGQGGFAPVRGTMVAGLATPSLEFGQVGFAPVPGTMVAGTPSWVHASGASVPMAAISPPYSIDWIVSTPLGNKTIAFVPDGKGGFKTTLVDADPVGMPQE